MLSKFAKCNISVPYDLTFVRRCGRLQVDSTGARGEPEAAGSRQRVRGRICGRAVRRLEK